MKRLTLSFLITAAGILGLTCTPAFARGHVEAGFYFGAPAYWGPYYAPPPIVYAPIPIYVQLAPVTYVEQPSGGTSTSAQRAEQITNGQGSDWYYCRDKGAYYPYVKYCASGWIRVPAHPDNNGG